MLACSPRTARFWRQRRSRQGSPSAHRDALLFHPPLRAAHVRSSRGRPDTAWARRPQRRGFHGGAPFSASP